MQNNLQHWNQIIRQKQVLNIKKGMVEETYTKNFWNLNLSHIITRPTNKLSVHILKNLATGTKFSDVIMNLKGKQMVKN